MNRIRRQLMQRWVVVLVLVLPLIEQGEVRLQPFVAGVELVQATDTSAMFDVETPRYELKPLGDGTQQIMVPGATLSSDEGMPQLPIWSAMLAVPTDADVQVHVVEDDHVNVPLHTMIAPVPQPDLLAPDQQPGALVRIPDGTAYASTTPYPAQVARIADDARLREQQFVRVAIAPLQYIARKQELVWHKHVRVAVQWSTPQQQSSIDVADPFATLFDSVALNAAAARWGMPPQLTAQTQGSPASPAPQFKIEVNHDGLYRLGYAELQAAGLDVTTVDPRTFMVTNQGKPVAIEVLGEADGRFDPGDEVRFWGEQFRTQTVPDTIVLDGRVIDADTQASALYSDATTYTDRNVYWLATSSAPGLRMRSVNGAPNDTAPHTTSFRAVVRAEQSQRWWTWHFTNRDTWFWDRIQTSVPTTRTYLTTLAAPAGDQTMATVTGELVARTAHGQIDPDHHVRVLLNDTLVADVQWDGRGRYRFEGEVPQTALIDGTNTLALQVLPPAGTSDDLWMDWFDVAYTRRSQARDDQIVVEANDDTETQYVVGGFMTPDVVVYNIGDARVPQRINNGIVEAFGDEYRATFAHSRSAGRYVASAGGALNQPLSIKRYVAPDLRTGGADYLVIAHGDLLAAAQRLARYRAAQGLRTRVVDVQDVYNVFNHGIVHPQAIKRFLAHAYAHWQAPVPRYVVLAGDGHWNLHGYAPDRYGTAPNLMPPNLAWVDPWQGEVDSANLLAAFVGDDLLPDVAIGRLPANNAAELNTMIDKIVAYEAAAPLQAWQRRLVFVADNAPDAAGDFAALSDTFIAQEVPAHMEVNRLYLDDVCGPAANPPAPCSTATTQLINTLNNDGALLVNYTGHASVNRWAHEQMFTTRNIPALENNDRLPVVVSMTCLDGYWFEPVEPGLAESLVRAPNGGAVATFSPTGLGVANGHDVLQRGLYRAMFADDVRTLGPATIAAKQALFATGEHDDLINTFVIIGDPALQLPLPSVTYMPFVTKHQP